MIYYRLYLITYNARAFYMMLFKIYILENRQDKKTIDKLKNIRTNLIIELYICCVIISFLNKY